MTEPQRVDLLVVGGGINGTGIARDAAGRGLSVLLVEKDDLARHTSSWSTKLIHGGLRYLEYYEFRLVREALIEREVLLDAAPHLIEPLRFVLPHHAGMRPSWLLRAGLFLYDHLGGRKLLPPTRRLDLRNGPLGGPLKPAYKKGFEYTDCRVDDARLVVVNAMDAADRGAEIRTRTRLVSSKRMDGEWHCELEAPRGTRSVCARAIVNAAGPWVTDTLTTADGATARKKIRLVKGSHLITRQLYDHDRAYIFQNRDKRIVFAIPYLEGTLIGTTDEAYTGDPADAKISDEEQRYLLASVNEYLTEEIGDDAVTATYSGVRPLYDDLTKEDASAVTRDYAFDVDRGNGGDKPPILSIYGGKLTTYRKLAEHALDALAASFPQMTGPWTKEAALPGGGTGYRRWAAFGQEMAARYGFLDEALPRMLGAYGDRLPSVLGAAEKIADLGQFFGHGLYEREVLYLLAHEFAVDENDVLDRRTKLGLRFSAEERRALGAFIHSVAVSDDPRAVSRPS